MAPRHRIVLRFDSPWPGPDEPYLPTRCNLTGADTPGIPSGPGQPAHRARWTPNRWLHQRAQTVVAALALTEVVTYLGTVAAVSDRWFPSTTAAWSLGGLGLALLAVLAAVIRWARHE